MEITASQLVDLAMQRMGFQRHAQLARELGLTAYDSPRRVKRWRDGENEPDFEATIALLDLLGALNQEALSGLPVGPEAEVVRKAQASVDAARAAGLSGEQRAPRRGAA